MDRKILRLAIPNIISNITVPLLGMVDMFIVGHLSSELYIGAIAVAGMIFNFIYWSFSFLRMGTSGFAAQAFGRKDKQESAHILLRSLAVAFVAGIMIVMLQYIILMLAFLAIDTSEIIKEYVAVYFHIYIWAAPAVLGMYAMTGWFIGMQDAKTPMFIAIAVNSINIVFSLLFVFVFGMEIKGVALGSMVAQVSGFLLCLLALKVKYKEMADYFHIRFVEKLSDFIPFFKVNSDIFLRTMCLIVVSTFFTSASAKMGDTFLAVNSLMMQLFLLFSYMMDGFGYAGEALAGRYLGERNTASLNSVVKRLFLWGGGLTLFFTVVYLFFSEDVLRILTDKENILQLADDYLFWALIIPVAGFAAFLWDGIFIGMTASGQMRNSMFIAMVSFFVIYFLLKSVLGNNALWLAFIIYLSVRGIIQAFMFKGIKRRAGLE